MPKLFHNPYHFVPLPEKPSGPERVSTVSDAGLPEHVTHASFVSETFSGTITCQLTTVSPVVIGSKQERDGVCNVQPFLGPGTEEPEIPGSSLRGLISSIFEPVTHSAFRVLSDRIFSYRKSMTEGLSSLGLIVERQGALHLYPLASPHLEATGRNLNDIDFSRGTPLPKNSGDYRKMFQGYYPKVYFGFKNDLNRIPFLEDFLSNSEPTGGPFYALPVDSLSEKIKGRPPQFCNLGDQTDLYPEPWDAKKHNEKDFIRGILRVLGVSSDTRAKGMPTRKHEFFIPFNADEAAGLKRGTAPVFPLLAEAVERFNQLADERTAEQKTTTPDVDLLPFTPHGQNRGSAGPDRPQRAYQLKAGDVVFFCPTPDGKSVAEVSLSSIWRGRVEKGAVGNKTAATLGEFIASADPALLPMGDPRKTHLTPAELLFGFVEKDGKRALASRLRCFSAEPLPNQKELLSTSWVDLQVLNSPKPPSPALYFQNRQGNDVITKSKISLEKHQIHGRKFYLHSKNVAAQPTPPPWTMHPKNVENGDFDDMRLRVRPIRPNANFTFQFHFDNLSAFELGSLLYALRPTPEFLHKLGLGKPLGLGSISITPVAVDLVDRAARYSADSLLAPRFSDRWHRENAAEPWKRVGEKASIARSPEECLAHFINELEKFDPSKKVLGVLQTIGNPENVKYDVHYPQVEGPLPGSADFELDRYEWFMANDDVRHAVPQALAPIRPEKPLPHFTAHPRRERRRL